jgi:hypothetical protein
VSWHPPFEGALVPDLDTDLGVRLGRADSRLAHDAKAVGYTGQEVGTRRIGEVDVHPAGQGAVAGQNGLADAPGLGPNGEALKDLIVDEGG